MLDRYPDCLLVSIKNKYHLPLPLFRQSTTTYGTYSLALEKRKTAFQYIYILCYRPLIKGIILELLDKLYFTCQPNRSLICVSFVSGCQRNCAQWFVLIILPRVNRILGSNSRKLTLLMPTFAPAWKEKRIILRQP